MACKVVGSEGANRFYRERGREAPVRSATERWERQARVRVSSVVRPEVNVWGRDKVPGVSECRIGKDRNETFRMLRAFELRPREAFLTRSHEIERGDKHWA